MKGTSMDVPLLSRLRQLNDPGNSTHDLASSRLDLVPPTTRLLGNFKLCSMHKVNEVGPYILYGARAIFHQGNVINVPVGPSASKFTYLLSQSHANSMDQTQRCCLRRGDPYRRSVTCEVTRSLARPCYSDQICVTYRSVHYK